MWKILAVKSTDRWKWTFPDFSEIAYFPLDTPYASVIWPTLLWIIFRVMWGSDCIYGDLKVHLTSNGHKRFSTWHLFRFTSTGRRRKQYKKHNCKAPYKQFWNFDIFFFSAFKPLLKRWCGTKWQITSLSLISELPGNCLGSIWRLSLIIWIVGVNELSQIASEKLADFCSQR